MNGDFLIQSVHNTIPSSGIYSTQERPLPSSTTLKAAAVTQPVFDQLPPQASSASISASELSLEEQMERLILAKRENNKIAIRQAIDQGPAAVVALLNENKVDPSVDDNALFVWAFHKKEDHILLMLLADKRVNPVTEYNYFNLCRWATDKGLDAVKLLLANPNFEPKDEGLFEWACLQGHACIVLQLSDKPKFDLAKIGGFLLGQCCKIGKVEVIPLLLNRCTPTLNHLELASINGHAEIVRMILVDGRVDPGADESRALRYAGTEEVATRLLGDPRVHPEAKGSSALFMASSHGKIGVVRALLHDGRSDPTVNLCVCLVSAYNNGHDAVVAELMQDQRVNPHGHTTYAAWFEDPRRLSQVCAITEYIKVDLPQPGISLIFGWCEGQVAPYSLSRAKIP